MPRQSRRTTFLSCPEPIAGRSWPVRRSRQFRPRGIPYIRNEVWPRMHAGSRAPRRRSRAAPVSTVMGPVRRPQLLTALWRGQPPGVRGMAVQFRAARRPTSAAGSCRDTRGTGLIMTRSSGGVDCNFRILMAWQRSFWRARAVRDAEPDQTSAGSRAGSPGGEQIKRRANCRRSMEAVVRATESRQRQENFIGARTGWLRTLFHRLAELVRRRWAANEHGAVASPTARGPSQPRRSGLRWPARNFRGPRSFFPQVGGRNG